MKSLFGWILIMWPIGILPVLMLIQAYQRGELLICLSIFGGAGLIMASVFLGFHLLSVD